VLAGAVHGAAQVSVKVLPVIDAGAMSSVNTAEIALLVATPAVGPGLVVAGTVSETLGRVVSARTPVVKRQTNGAVIARPVARLRAPVTVAV